MAPDPQTPAERIRQAEAYTPEDVADLLDQLTAAEQQLADLKQKLPPYATAADVEVFALLEATIHASRGEPVSDFMASFQVVRAVLDLRADATALRQQRDEALAIAYTDPRTQTRSWQTAYQDAHAGNVALTAQLEAAATSPADQEPETP